MNMLLPKPVLHRVPVTPRLPEETARCLMDAGQRLLESLSTGKPIDAATLRHWPLLPLWRLT